MNIGLLLFILLFIVLITPVHSVRRESFLSSSIQVPPPPGALMLGSQMEVDREHKTDILSRIPYVRLQDPTQIQWL